MSQKTDNGEPMRNSSKSSVAVVEGQDGGCGNENKQEITSGHDVTESKGHLPLVHVRGSHGDGVDHTTGDCSSNKQNKPEPNQGEPSEMNKQNIVKTSQEEQIAEEQMPLNSLELSPDDTSALQNEVKMEESSMTQETEPDPDIIKEVKEDAAESKSSDGGGKQAVVEKLSPVMEAAVAAFASGMNKSGCDLNENNTAVPSGRDGGSSLPSSPERQAKPPHTHLISSAEMRTDSFEIATKDDVDAGSVYSLFMEKDFRYHFQHPYCRLFAAYFVTFCNFLIYAEDPVAHSRSECTIPVIGNDFSFVIMKWPPNAWSLLKTAMWLSAIIIGIIIGKIVFHSFLFNRVLRLKMFHDDRGSWMVSFMTTVLVLFIFSYVYNGLLMIGGDYTRQFHISSYMGVSNSMFMKAAATGTWCGDFFTAWMVTDMMLQERLYPDWARPLRKWWNTGIRRILLFWIVVASSSFAVIFVIATDYINWDSLNRDFLHSNEISRAFLASFILCLDITIVMQDWDFPHFVGAIDVKLPGVNKAHVYFKIPKLLKSLEYWHIHISGKWFNYGILFIVILLDLNMWKNQIFYTPYQYGQYVDEFGRIHTVMDQFSLDNANSSTLTFEYRNVTINPDTGERYILGDTMMNARYNGYTKTVKMMAFVPSLAVFLVFGTMVGIYGRRPKPTKMDPYGGRLRKRRRRFNARKKWNSLRTWFRGSMPTLTRFRQRRQTRASGGSGGRGGKAAASGGASGGSTAASKGGDISVVSNKDDGSKQTV